MVSFSRILDHSDQLKRVFCHVCLAAWVCICVAVDAAAGDASWVKVHMAIDGDTLRLHDGRLVRLIGIDAPEIDHNSHPAEPLAYNALRLLGRLVNGKRVRLESDRATHDTYGRTLAYVYNDKGDLINLALITRGFAYVRCVPPNIEAHEQLLKAQREAMATKRGIWQNLNNHKGPFVGNPHSKRFHLLKCSSAKKIHPQHAVAISTAKEAFHMGFAPCKRCISNQKKELKQR